MSRFMNAKVWSLVLLVGLMALAIVWACFFFVDTTVERGRFNLAGSGVAIAFTPSGKSLVSVSTRYSPTEQKPIVTVQIWDAYTLRQFRSTQQLDVVKTIAVCPRSSLLACCGNELSLFDTETACEVATLSSGGTCIAFSPDGQVLVKADGPFMAFWDVQSRSLIDEVADPPGAISVVRFSPDGLTMASANDRRHIKLRNAKTFAILRTLQHHDSPITGLEFTPDSRLLISGSLDGTLKVWDIAARDLEPSVLFKNPKSTLSCLAISNDGKWLAGGTGATITVWDLHRRVRAAVFRGHWLSVVGVCFSPDSRTIASISVDGIVKLWKSPDL